MPLDTDRCLRPLAAPSVTYRYVLLMPLVAGRYSSTLKGTLLESVPLGVTTLTLPVVAPAGTVVVISDLETTVNVAAVPLNVTLVAPVRSVPRILTAAPTLPEVGTVSTNGPRPTARLKIVPSLLVPPSKVVP